MKIKKPNRGKYSVVTLVKCHICNKEVKARGLAGHLSLVHKIRRVIETTHTNEVHVNTSESIPGIPQAPKVVEKQVTERISKYVSSLQQCEICGRKEPIWDEIDECRNIEDYSFKIGCARGGYHKGGRIPPKHK